MKTDKYSKPFMKMEVFTPQEFVAGCSLVIDSLPTSGVSGLLRIDWDGDGIMDYYDNERYVDSHMGTQTATLSRFEIIDCNVYKLEKPSNGNLGSVEDGFDYINGGRYEDTFHSTAEYKYSLYATKLARNTYIANGAYYIIFENNLGQASAHKNNS